MQTHCRQEHGRRTSKGRPRKDTQHNTPWESGVTCQRLRNVAPGKKPFQVYNVAAITDPIAIGLGEALNQVNRPKDTQQYINEQLIASETRQAALNPPLLAANGGSKRSATFTQSPWLVLTQWPVYFSNIRLADVPPLIELPSIEPSSLECEEDAVENSMPNINVLDDGEYSSFFLVLSL